MVQRRINRRRGNRFNFSRLSSRYGFRIRVQKIKLVAMNRLGNFRKLHFAPRGLESRNCSLLQRHRFWYGTVRSRGFIGKFVVADTRFLEQLDVIEQFYIVNDHLARLLCRDVHNVFNRVREPVDLRRI